MIVFTLTETVTLMQDSVNLYKAQQALNVVCSIEYTATIQRLITDCPNAHLGRLSVALFPLPHIPKTNTHTHTHTLIVNG